MSHSECLLLEVTQENVRYKQVRWTSYLAFQGGEILNDLLVETENVYNNINRN
jgi:hypothetical protein